MPIINQIVKGGGTTPTGTTYITTNGTHDVTNYATADVQVPTTAPASYRAFEKNASGKLVNSTSTPWIPLPAGTTDIGDYCFVNAYMNTPSSVLSGAIDLSSLTKISGEKAFEKCFYNCTGITSFDLSSLIEVTNTSACNYMFGGCTGITNVNLSSLTKITSNGGCSFMFNNAGVTSVDLSSLTFVGIFGCRYMFANTGLTNVILYSLTKIYDGSSPLGYMFAGCSYLTSLSFPSLTPLSFGSYTNQFNDMLSGVTGCTVHFPSNIQSTIGSWASVTGGFGGTNTTVLFDLPATVTLTGSDTVTYTRNPKYDTATALAWKVGAYGTTNFTPAYYTSGTTNPVANDTIYSDSACTTAVTTIDSIA